MINSADADEDLTVKNDGGSTIATVARGEFAIVMLQAASWYVVADSSAAGADFGGEWGRQAAREKAEALVAARKI